MALPQKNRLTNKKNIDEIYQNGKTVKSSFFFVRYLPNQLHNTRIAVIVSKKVSPLAVRRHKMKRIIATLLNNQNMLHQCVDLIVVLTRSILEKDHKEIKSELDKTIQKISV